MQLQRNALAAIAAAVLGAVATGGLVAAAAAERPATVAPGEEIRIEVPASQSVAALRVQPVQPNALVELPGLTVSVSISLPPLLPTTTTPPATSATTPRPPDPNEPTTTGPTTTTGGGLLPGISLPPIVLPTGGYTPRPTETPPCMSSDC